MKKSFLSFVAVVVGFFVSLELSAFKLTVSPEPGEVESLSSLTFYNETSGKQLYDSGNYAKLITVCKEDGTELKSFHFGNFVAGDGFLYRTLTEEAFGDPITVAGTYIVKVPAGFFNQNFLGTMQCEEQTFTYTVTGNGDGGGGTVDPDPEPGGSDLTAAEIAAKLVGDYVTKRSGETRISAGNYEAYSKEYENNIIAEGDDIIIINADGNGNNFRGIIDPEKMTVYFDRPNMSYWWTGNSSQDYSTGFYAEIGEDFNSLTFEEWHKVYNNTNWESSTSHVMTKLAERVLVWEVEGDINWTLADGTPSYYISDLEGVKLAKYTRGDEVSYKLEKLGGAYYNAPSMEFMVVDGKIAPTNWGEYQRYLYVQSSFDMVKPLVENSSFNGDEKGGKFTFAYDHYDAYYSSYPDESGTMTFIWGNGPVLTAAEIAQKLVGDYVTKRSGETRISAGNYQAYTKEYENSIIAEGDDIIIINADGNGNNFRGIIDPEKMTVYFDRPNISYYWTGNSSQDYSTGFYAEIAEDFNSLTFEEWHKVYNNANWESSTSHVMTKLAELVLEWETEGNIAWTGADGKSSWYVSDLQGVKFAKYTRGDEVSYKLEKLGGSYYNAPSMEFKVVDGKLVPTNWGGYQRYLYVENGYDMLKPQVENSTIEGDAEGGMFSFAYDYYTYYYSTYPDESGTMTFTWGTYIKEPEVEPFLPEYVSDPAEGSVLNTQLVNDISIEFPGYVDIYYGYGSKIEVKDAEGNDLYTNAYFEFRDYNYSKLYITNLGLVDPGTYTVVVKGGSLFVTSDWSSYQNITEDIAVTFTIEHEWDGSVVLPDYVTTTDELLELPVTFPDAREVAVTNFGALGAIFDETGSIFALLFPEANAGGVEVDGATANVRFEKMSTLRAQNATLAESLAQRIGGFVEPETGVATVFICPKSFKVNGTLYTEAITKTYEVAGSGLSTGIEAVENGDDNAAIYNLHGRRITSATKGIVIRNGVKEIK